MESEGSLPHSQEPATCPYPELDRPSAWAHNPLLEDPFEYYPPMYAWVFKVVFFRQALPPKPCMHLPSPPDLSLLDLITRIMFGEKYRAMKLIVTACVRACVRANVDFLFGV